jgi:hypothetical protein
MGQHLQEQFIDLSDRGPAADEIAEHALDGSQEPRNGPDSI